MSNALMGVFIDGELKATRTGADPVPDDLGVGLLKELRSASGLEDLRSMARKLRVIEGREANDQEFSYGDLLDILRDGRIEGDEDFGADSVYCQWGYVVNLDEERFEVYRGDQSAPHAEGLFSHLTPETQGYPPIRLVASFPLASLPTDAEFIAHVKRALDATGIVCPHCYSPDQTIDAGRQQPCVCQTCGHEWVQH